ncbi:tyrosine-type recombinase/integrase [Terriglobus albidus]|uniref:tyrosine-type recombinase/integrase n=1 Tax=Terriglobus albidus TaxID=1592106 RepID=UPI0037D9DDDB
MTETVWSVLSKWHSVTEYSRPEDWVFASPRAEGKLPYWPHTLLGRQIRPAADRAGIEKQIGWHTFRRTFATLLESAGVGLKVTQELMRHSTPTMTLSKYAQAVTPAKREAQTLLAAQLGV